MKLLTMRDEMTRVQVAKGEWKRLKDDCRSAAVPNGLRRLPLSMSVERLKEYRTIKLSFAVNLKSYLVESRKSWTNAEAEVLTTDAVVRSRSPTGTACSWWRYSKAANQKARSLLIGPPAEPPNCSRAKCGAGKSRLSAGFACSALCRKKKKAEP